MGRFTADQVDHYGGQGGAGFFKLVNHGDSAKVRFLYSSIQDVEGYAIHPIPTEDSRKPLYINCLREYNEPKDKCAFCRAGIPQQAKLFIPLYDLDDGKVKIWDRGKTAFAKISSLCSRYPNLVSRVFDVIRNGAAGDNKTTYDIYPDENNREPASIEDFEVPEVLGGIVLEKSAEDMEYYLENKQFPPTGDDMPVRRRSSQAADNGNSSYNRRTPANRGGNSF